jgi:uncharacterized protein YbjT (DUF2867 family)
MRVLLTGASGFVGRNLAMALTEQGHVVRPVSRRHGVDMGQMLEPADWLTCLEGIDAVVNAAGIIAETGGQRFGPLHTQAPVALFKACSAVGVRRVVQISALGAHGQAFSRYHLSKHAADQALLGLDVQGTVLRPSLIYGRGGTSSALLLRLAAWPLVPLLQAGQQPIQPVHISDVVATILRVLSAAVPPRELDIVGPQTLCWREWMQTLRAARGLPPGRCLPVPYPVALALSWLLQPLHPLAAPDNLRMLQRGYRADSQAAEHWLGRPLRPPQPELPFQDGSILWREVMSAAGRSQAHIPERAARRAFE